MKFKCNHCGEDVDVIDRHLRWDPPHDISYFCPPKAERSEVLQGCPPSANCSAGAGADARNDSLIGSPVPRDKRSETWPHVLLFAERMEAKLAKNRHKGDRLGWLQTHPKRLTILLQMEVLELLKEMETGDAEAIANECADVANFALMVADWFTAHADVNVSDAPHCKGERALALNSVISNQPAKTKNTNALD